MAPRTGDQQARPRSAGALSPAPPPGQQLFCTRESASSSRVDWAILMQRTFGFNSLRCPQCASKMRILATLTEPAGVKKILSHLGMRTQPLPRGRALSPTGQESFDFEAA